MSATDSHLEPSRLHVLQQRISTSTWFIVFLLSLRGLYAFYGMKEKGSIERAVNFVTEPIVQLFQFKSLQDLDIPGITAFFAILSVLIASYSAQFIVRVTEYRYAKARTYLAQQLLSVK